MADGRRLSRRGALGVLGATGATAALAGTGLLTGGSRPATAASRFGDVVPFEGVHQAGITTPTQEQMLFTSFDVRTDSRAELRDLMRTWTEAARLLTAGAAIGEGTQSAPQVPPDDTGEAVGFEANNLTLTFGVGPSLFAPGRLGLEGRRPDALVELPPFAGEALDPARSGGDLCIQACADDPQVAVHAIRNLARLGRGVVEVRWSQLGFGRAASTSAAQGTPRNLFGFKDGTRNVRSEDPAALEASVWVQPGDGPEWMTGGSYLVARRVRMLTEVWDRSSLLDQEQTIGRTKRTGAPLTGRDEFDALDLDAKGADGLPVIPMTAHVRLASPESNGGATMLRRGYSFTDGSDGLGRLDAGLFFLAYQRDTREQFIRINTKLTSGDELLEYTKDTGSAHFAVPPGVQGADDYWARALLT